MKLIISLSFLIWSSIWGLMGRGFNRLHCLNRTGVCVRGWVCVSCRREFGHLIEEGFVPLLFGTVTYFWI